MSIRPLLKDTIRRGLDFSARLTSHLPRRPAARMLVYHEVLEQGSACPNPYNQVAASRFAAQLDGLLDSGCRFVTVSQLASSIASGTAPDADLLSITFDDGLQEHASLVLPMLRQRRIPATFFVLTGRIGMARGRAHAGSRYLTADEIRSLAEAGMEIGSHGRSHAVLNRLGSVELEGETAGSRDDLGAILGHPPASFAYPYGSRDTYGPEVVEAVRRAGYSSAVCTVLGANRPGVSLFELKRIPVYDTDGPEVVLARARGAYDWTGSLQEVWLRVFPHHASQRHAR